MNFYKHATDDDFKKAIKDYGYYIPEPLRKMIEKENKVSSQMVKLYRDTTLESLQVCRKTLEKYLTIMNAYEDFKNGKTVFAKY